MAERREEIMDNLKALRCARCMGYVIRSGKDNKCPECGGILIPMGSVIHIDKPTKSKKKESK